MVKAVTAHDRAPRGTAATHCVGPAGPTGDTKLVIAAAELQSVQRTADPSGTVTAVLDVLRRNF